MEYFALKLTGLVEMILKIVMMGLLYFIIYASLNGKDKEALEKEIKKKQSRDKVMGYFQIIGYAGLVLVFGYISFFPSSNSYDKKMIMKEAQYYESVGKYYLDDYKDNNGKGVLVYLNPSNKDGVIQAKCVTQPYEHELILTKDIYTKYNKINEHFRIGRSHLSSISVYDSYVVFGIESGRAAVIYSDNKKKPKYVNGGTMMDKEKENYIDFITDHLYYGCWKE